MNNDILIGKIEKWTEKLAEKDFQQFTQAEQEEIKRDYKLAEEQAKGYGTGARCTLAVKAFEKRVADMEGFFYETEQA